MASIFASIRVAGQFYRDTDHWWRYARILFAYYASGQWKYAWIRGALRHFASLTSAGRGLLRDFASKCVRIWWGYAAALGAAQAEEVLRQFYAGLGVEQGLTPPLFGRRMRQCVRMRQDEAKRVEEQIRGIEESIWTKGKVIWTRPAGMAEGLKIGGGGSSNVVGIINPPSRWDRVSWSEKIWGAAPPLPPKFRHPCSERPWQWKWILS